jgi:hypothetical protein
MDLKKMLTGHLLVLALTFPHAALAEDFTINVPVELSNIHPEVKQMRILCEIEGIVTVDPFTLINVPADGGAINSTVQVKFNSRDKIEPYRDPVKKSYACHLEAAKAGGDFQWFLASNSSQCNAANEWRCARPDTPSTIDINGVFDLYK